MYPKEFKLGQIETLAHPCLLTMNNTQHYSQWASYGNGQDALELMNGLRKYDIYIYRME
jgi:hypothetical protein